MTRTFLPITIVIAALLFPFAHASAVEMEGMWTRSGAGHEGMYLVVFDKYVDELFMVKGEPQYLRGDNAGGEGYDAKMTRNGEVWAFTAVWGGDNASYQLRRVNANEYAGKSSGGTSKWVRMKVSAEEYGGMAAMQINRRTWVRLIDARNHGTESEKKAREREHAEAKADLMKYMKF